MVAYSCGHHNQFPRLARDPVRNRRCLRRAAGCQGRPLILGLLFLSMKSVAAQPAATPALEELRAKARERMERERATFTMEQVREIESLYQSANRDLRAPSSKEANRAGCALLYLAQLSPPAERETFLTRAIADHSDAWYGDGTQVGPFAKAQLERGNRLTDMLRKMKLLQ
jgi:hypothetical protein